jgi:hypothetical protein
LKNHSSDTSTVNNFFRVNLGPSEGEKNGAHHIIKLSTGVAETQAFLVLPNAFQLASLLVTVPVPNRLALCNWNVAA